MTSFKSSNDFESTATKTDPASSSLLSQKETFLTEQTECNNRAQQKLTSPTKILRKHVVLFLIGFIVILLIVSIGLTVYIIAEMTKKVPISLEDNTAID